MLWFMDFPPSSILLYVPMMAKSPVGSIMIPIEKLAESLMLKDASMTPPLVKK